MPLQMSLIMLVEKCETPPPILVFRMTYFCSAWKRPSPCFQFVPTTTVVVLIRQPSQNIHISRVGIDVLSAVPYSKRILGRAPLLVGDTTEVASLSVTSTEFDCI